MISINLNTLGWNPFFNTAFYPYQETGFSAGRIAIENKNNYVVLTGQGPLTAEITGKLRFTANTSAELPKVGDWVVLTLFEQEQKAIIHDVLPRKTRFSRKEAGHRTEEQIIATNLDRIFIVQGLDGNFNPRRIERYLVQIRQSKIDPVIVFNKADLCQDTDKKVAEMHSLVRDVPIVTVSAKNRTGFSELEKYVQSGLTIAFVGSSGVGKSTLINQLMGEDRLQTGNVRTVDDKGKHTTTRRELILLENGAILIDTPGMRELQLWNIEDHATEAFSEIEQLATDCRYADCTHTHEAGCAVLAAIEEGELSEGQYHNYLKMQRELRYLEEKQSEKGLLERKAREKQIHKHMRKIWKREK